MVKFSCAKGHISMMEIKNNEISFIIDECVIKCPIDNAFDGLKRELMIE